MTRDDALQMICNERERQISDEGWTAAHDDGHDNGEILTAAVYYYHHAMGGDRLIYVDDVPLGWLWAREWWKPKTPERDLVRAGALCLAEMDRLRRLGRPTAAHVDHKLNLIITALAAIPAPTREEEGGK